MDPLARPQSVFAVQKVLQTAVAEKKVAGSLSAAETADREPASGWRGLVNRLRGS
jgi:hypothetical protein